MQNTISNQPINTKSNLPNEPICAMTGFQS